MLIPEDLEFPRTVAVDFMGLTTRPLEISSKQSVESRRYRISIYSTLRGDIADLTEALYGAFHGSGSDISFPSWFSSSAVVGAVMYDNIIVVNNPPFRVEDKTVYSAFIDVDVVSTRGG